ncbi:hypothetical protein [Helicobacter sp. NHP22-001]|uniref:hypothetical protein n=1 Tax=Helicobacter sp. NHP22-001 TaxID=3040202 RepID=UPI0025547055|nr:hypothetical protein [Helicobacter sp. NHP22-001]
MIYRKKGNAKAEKFLEKAFDFGYEKTKEQIKWLPMSKPLFILFLGASALIAAPPILPQKLFAT